MNSKKVWSFDRHKAPFEELWISTTHQNSSLPSSPACSPQHEPRQYTLIPGAPMSKLDVQASAGSGYGSEWIAL